MVHNSDKFVSFRATEVRRTLPDNLLTIPILLTKSINSAQGGASFNEKVQKTQKAPP